MVILATLKILTAIKKKAPIKTVMLDTAKYPNLTAGESSISFEDKTYGVIRYERQGKKIKAVVVQLS